MKLPDCLKFLFLTFSLFILSSCSDQQDDKLPFGKAITINGQLSEKDWVAAFRFEDSQNGTTILMFQDAEWINIAIPIEQHKDLPASTEITKDRLSYVEIHLKTPENAWTLHASSMNGQKLLLAETDFEWKDFEDWKANPEGVKQNGKTVICEAYEYRIRKGMIASETFDLIATIHPFYEESFDPIFIPTQKSTELKEWINVVL